MMMISGGLNHSDLNERFTTFSFTKQHRTIFVKQFDEGKKIKWLAEQNKSVHAAFLNISVNVMSEQKQQVVIVVR